VQLDSKKVVIGALFAQTSPSSLVGFWHGIPAHAIVTPTFALDYPEWIFGGQVRPNSEYVGYPIDTAHHPA